MLYFMLSVIPILHQGMYSCKCPAVWVGKQFSFLENGEEIQIERGKEKGKKDKGEEEKKRGK